MQRRKTVVIGILCVLTLALAVNLVHAAGTADVASVWVTSDFAGNIKINTFTPGQTVYIWWNAIDTVPNPTVDVKIVDSAGNLVYQPAGWLGVGMLGTQPLSWTAQPGYYYVVVNGAVSYTYPIAVASIFILPESALGTLMATTAGFAAFGTIAIVKHKRAGNKK